MACTFFAPNRCRYLEIHQIVITDQGCDAPAHSMELAVEFMTVTGMSENRRYIAIYRKWFNEKLGAWELEMVPGTLRWVN